MEDAHKWKRYQIMKEMGWTLNEYQSAPSSFIEEIWMFIQTEAKAIQDKMPEIK